MCHLSILTLFDACAQGVTLRFESEYNSMQKKIVLARNTAIELEASEAA